MFIGNKSSSGLHPRRHEGTRRWTMNIFLQNSIEQCTLLLLPRSASRRTCQHSGCSNFFPDLSYNSTWQSHKKTQVHVYMTRFSCSRATEVKIDFRGSICQESCFDISAATSPPIIASPRTSTVYIVMKIPKTKRVNYI